MPAETRRSARSQQKVASGSKVLVPSTSGADGQALRKRTTRLLPNRVREHMQLAASEGLIGPKTRMIRGRMPEALVQKAKERTGIESDTELLEAALAYVAVADDYAEWLISQRGTIDPDIDLGF